VTVMFDIRPDSLIPDPGPRSGGPVVLLTPVPLFVAPALGITPATINLMAREGRGLICHAMTAAQMLEMGLRLIPHRNDRADAWRYAVSYEAGSGCSTGISAADRARTLNAGARGQAAEIAMPGHVIPVLADPDAPDLMGHPPSAALALMRRAGLGGGAAICTILDPEGHVASPDAALALARRLDLGVALPGGDL
jgi:3,4-dihydroxy 2-butanone 4-phosphate synthase / GTP cyclohydrolase II